MDDQGNHIPDGKGSFLTVNAQRKRTKSRSDEGFEEHVDEVIPRPPAMYGGWGAMGRGLSTTSV